MRPAASPWPVGRPLIVRASHRRRQKDSPKLVRVPPPKMLGRGVAAYVYQPAPDELGFDTSPAGRVVKGKVVGGVSDGDMGWQLVHDAPWHF